MKKHKQTPAEAVQQLLDIGPSETDPQGSWTGRPVNEGELPVQDADDL